MDALRVRGCCIIDCRGYQGISALLDGMMLMRGLLFVTCKVGSDLLVYE
jgi:hypothetical protein